MAEASPEPVQLGLWFLVWATLFLLVGGPTVFFWFIAEAVWLGPAVSGFVLLLFILYAVWLPFYHRSHHYTYDADELGVRYGVVWKHHALIPLGRITNLKIVRGPLERLAGVGKLSVHTAGHSGEAQAEATLKGLADPDVVRNALMERVRSVRAGDGSGDTGSGTRSAGSRGPDDAVLQELRAIRRLLEDQA